ncbi:hypothetical protein [Proteus terrae]|nr:hypothetical protein [Proteus terrae]
MRDFMSSEYEEYAKWEERKANIAVGRHPNAPSGSVAFSEPSNGEKLIRQPEEKPIVYSDENGRKFTVFSGRRDYFDEDDL